MPLKKAQGNMYDWVSHVHSHLGGECKHKCKYCYVQKNRFGVNPRYTGEIRLIESEFKINYGKDKIIFIEHMNDLFAEGVSEDMIISILQRCSLYTESFNSYVFQTKNPERAFVYYQEGYFPSKFMIGTTIETNRDMSAISKAPPVESRATGIWKFKQAGKQTFITIEPIMDFDEKLINIIINCNPGFVNIGADSKNCKLPEPSKEKIVRLVYCLTKSNILIKKKTNLKRIVGGYYD